MKHVKKKMVGDVEVVYPKGMFTGGKETDELDAALIGAFKDSGGKLVVNLHNTKFLTTAGLSTLVRAYMHYVQRGGRICICHVNDRITMLFVITKLVMVFETYETEEEAVASFQDWKPPEVPEEIAATR